MTTEHNDGDCKGVVFYQSVSRGISNLDGEQPITYFGKVYRIPRSEHGTLRQLEWEMSPGELASSAALADGTRAEPVREAVIERFEVYDRESGDVWVMYRVPCRASA